MKNQQNRQTASSSGFSPDPASFYFPATGIQTSGSALLLALDDVTFPVKHNLCLDLTKPTVRVEPVLTPSPLDSNAPDNFMVFFYGTVLHDEGRFRMWYYPCHWGVNPDWDGHHARQLAKWDLPYFQGPLCYAESEDGLTWTKPHLHQLLFKGSKENNAFNLPHTLVSCATVIKDENDPDPARRYKMVYEFFPEFSDPPLEGLTSGMPTCALAASADGIQWDLLSTPYPNEFIEHASFYQHDGKYIINSQNFDLQIPGEGGTKRGRQGFARFSTDFNHWLEGAVESFALPEPAVPEARGISGLYDQVHLGVGAVSFGTVSVGLFGLWHNNDFWNEFDLISCDLGLVISNDGLHFREPVKGHFFLSRHDSPAAPFPGKDYNTNLCQANGILNVGDETRIYHGRWRNTSDKPDDIENGYGEVGLATLPRDRWGALRLPSHHSSGSVWSAPIVLPAADCELFLNVEGARGIRVEIADENFNLLSEYSGDNGGSTSDESGFDCKVAWPKSSLSILEGKTIRLKIHLQAGEYPQPRFYAASLKNK